MFAYNHNCIYFQIALFCLEQFICIQLYDIQLNNYSFKWLRLLQITCTVGRFQVFLSYTNNLYTIICLFAALTYTAVEYANGTST